MARELKNKDIVSLKEASDAFDVFKKSNPSARLKKWAEQQDVPYQALRSFRAMAAKGGIEIVPSRPKHPNERKPKLGRPRGSGTTKGRTSAMREKAELVKVYEELGRLHMLMLKGGKP